MSIGSIGASQADRKAYRGRTRPRLEIVIKALLRPVEAQVAVELQRGMLVADAVERGDPRADVARRVEVALDDLVLLRVEVFLLAAQRAVLAQVEPGIDAPRGGERRRQRGAEQERR